MKKIVTFALLTIFFMSCGPKRMGCGPKRVCKTSKLKMETLSNKESNLEITKV